MTMNETHGITEDAVTGNAETGQIKDSQVENTTKTFTQDEVNELIGKRVAQVNKKFDGVDVDEYKALKGLKEQIEEEQLIKKEDFNSVLKKHKDKSDAEVSRLRNELETIKIDGALINASSKAKAVSPEHVAQLLRKNIKLGEDGNVVVTDSAGKTRYTDNADLMSVDNLVEEFLSSNQYFKAAGPSGSGSSGNTNNASQQSLDLAQLDMNNPEHRKVYTEMKRQGKV
tara:strand:+ start:4277 stop:4960 length:684 start_codon:yes stop_codon:yes gene_type:complete